jgi:hypothetical protein
MALTKKIKFLTTSLEMYENYDILHPEPAIKNIPDWYKDLAQHYDTNSVEFLNPVNDRGTDGANVSTKMCYPFRDAMTAGYVYKLTKDLEVSLDPDGKPTISWEDDSLMMMDKRYILDMVPPEGHHPVHFGLRMHWYYETPPGYSILLTHPMNRYDLPFTIPSGIIESDLFGIPVFISFFLKKNFIGTIPKGTPLFQLIPFKREDWEMEVSLDPEEVLQKEYDLENRRTRLFAYYKRFAWRKKNYS